MLLFHYPWAPYARKALLAAYETGAVFDEELTPPFSATHMRALRERTSYPLATVPLLLLDDGSYFSESSSIVEYFDLTKRRGPDLVPSDPHAALQVRALDRLAEAILSPTMYLTWALRKPAGVRNDKRIEETFAKLRPTLDVYEQRLAKHPFVFGESFTMADIGPACGISVMLADRSIERAFLVEWPSLRRWFESVEARPSFRQLLERADLVPRPPELQ